VRFVPQEAGTTAMLERGLLRLTGATNLQAAWLSLVRTQDTIGIKVFSRPGATSGTRPTVVEAVVKGLLAAGVPAPQIVIWDRHQVDLRLAGYGELAERHGVRLAGSADSGWDPKVALETSFIGQLVYGDLEFGQTGTAVGRKSHFSKLLTGGMTRLISITPLLNNNLAGVSGHCWGLAVSATDNTLRFENNAVSMAETLPDILALPEGKLADRFVLGITDAMLCQYQGEERQLLHYSAVLDQLWLSRDPVALDVLAVREIERQRQLNAIITARTPMDLYDNLALLELGVASPSRIDVERLTPP
jgi:hypothetical protein